MHEKTKQNDERRTKNCGRHPLPFWNRCGGYHGQGHTAGKSCQEMASKVQVLRNGENREDLFRYQDGFECGI